MINIFGWLKRGYKGQAMCKGSISQCSQLTNETLISSRVHMHVDMCIQMCIHTHKHGKLKLKP